MKFISLITFMVLSSPVIANILNLSTECQSLRFNPKVGYIFFNTDDGDSIDCNQIQIILNTTREIAKLSPIDFGPVDYEIIEMGWDASNLINYIYLPQNFERYNSEGSYFLNQPLANNYLAHEYGHSIFNEMIRQHHSDLNESFTIIQKNNSKIIQKNILLAQGKLEEATSLADDIANKEIEIFTSAKIMTPIFKVVAMSELFSDLVAVLYAEDLQAFSKAASGQFADPQEKESNKLRDFSLNHPLEHWDNDEKHDLYAPTRSFIGKRLRFPMSLDRKKKILKKLLDIMKDQLSYESQTENRTPQELNQVLINKLKSINFP